MTNALTKTEDNPILAHLAERHRGRGQPTKFDTEIAASIIEDMADNGVSFSKAAENAGIARSTLFLWRKAHPTFDEAIKAAMAAQVQARLDKWDADAERTYSPDSEAKAPDANEIRRLDMIGRNNRWLAERASPDYSDRGAREPAVSVSLTVMFDQLRQVSDPHVTIDAQATEADKPGE